MHYQLVALHYQDETQFVSLLFLDFKLNTKQGTAKEIIHLLLFIKCIKKNLLKEKLRTCRSEKNAESKQRKETNSNDKKTFMRIHIILEIYVYT